MIELVMKRLQEKRSNFPLAGETSQYRAKAWVPLLIAMLVFALAFGATYWRISLAPDVFTDEILYTRLGIRALQEGALVWDSGRPMLVHPPLYFLTEAVYLRLTGGLDLPLYTPGNIFTAVYRARGLNSLLAGFTAALLFFLGLRLRNLKLGLLLAALFLLDPFGLRINRRAMIETLAASFALSGMTVLLTEEGEGRLAFGRAILAGLLLSAGLLAKELVFTAPLAAGLWGLWELRRRQAPRLPVRVASQEKAFDDMPPQTSVEHSSPVSGHARLQLVSTSGLSRIRPFPQKFARLLQSDSSWQAPILASLLAFTSYLIFPVWTRLSGNWSEFGREKTFSLQRLLGIVHTSGWNRSEVSLLEFLSSRLLDYGSTYLLLGLGGLALLGLWAWARHDRPARLLITWGAVLYPFYAFLALFGSGNDQFFYYLLHPALLLIGYLLLGVSAVENPLIGRDDQPYRWSRMADRLYRNWPSARRFIVIGLLILVLPYNLARWWASFGSGVDNGYAQLATFVNENIPPGLPINASGDPIKFRYFFPGHPIEAASTPLEAQRLGLTCFVLTPKDVRVRYGQITPELQTWIVQNGQLLFAARGESYEDIYFYQVGQPEAQPVDFERTFAVAQTGYVNSFVAMGLGWFSLWGCVAIWLVYLTGRLPNTTVNGWTRMQKEANDE